MVLWLTFVDQSVVGCGEPYMEVLLCLSHTKPLRRTGVGSAPAMWNFLDNAKLHVEDPGLAERESAPSLVSEDEMMAGITALYIMIHPYMHPEIKQKTAPALPIRYSMMFSVLASTGLTSSWRVLA